MKDKKNTNIYLIIPIFIILQKISGADSNLSDKPKRLCTWQNSTFSNLSRALLSKKIKPNKQ